MAKISLRAYIREVEKLINQQKLDEAIAHCKHILKQFPKHVDSYRLLGSSYLEDKRYSEASDIFQRVLSVIPDDLIAHIGMSIIREDERNYDSAIWHMERAFEIQPSASSIQDDLRRLFTDRDGTEPSKIPLTKGALIRMYERGELYPQAIAEIHEALTGEPDRIDLEVLLARMYHHSGQQKEAIRACERLIKKSPFSYEANRILADYYKQNQDFESAAVFSEKIVRNVSRGNPKVSGILSSVWPCGVHN